MKYNQKQTQIKVIYIYTIISSNTFIQLYVQKIILTRYILKLKCNIM